VRYGIPHAPKGQRRGKAMARNRFVSVFAIAACGVLLTSGSVAAATSAPVTRAKAGVREARDDATALSRGGPVFFTAYQNDDLPGATVVLSGAIGDFGAAVSVLPNGAVDPEHSSQLKLALTQGSFRIVIGRLHAKLLGALNHAPYNRRTCSGHVSVTGAAPVVAGSGTGAYKGISGAFTLTITGNEVDAKPGCQPFSGSALLAQTIFFAGSGTVSFR
jgi:hypothetical protein